MSESQTKQPAAPLKRTNPAVHLLAIVILAGLSVIGHVAVIWAGELRGYQPSKLVALRDVLLFVPIVAAFLWLNRKQKFRGELMPLTAAVLLFAFGLVVQYRMFNDPEYGSKGTERTQARKSKAETIRLLNIRTGYDDEKKTFLFGAPDRVPDRPAPKAPQQSDVSFERVLTSANTYIPVFALLAMAAGFVLFRREDVLLWLQRHALFIGLVTLLPFAALVLLFSDEGKFLGQTTPWEAVKILFLASFAGMLADTYRHLRRTRWGLPPARYLFPFLIIATMPVLPFFALSDFGQMLVFFGVYVMLYVVAVRKKAQLVYGIALVALVFGVFFAASSAKTGFGVPGRVYFRFYQWLHTWEPPPPDTWWWKRDFERYLQAKKITVDPNDNEQMRQWNTEAWSDKVLQQSQGVLGVHEGSITGEGLGLGFPETVPVSDSDFIYAAVAEETGLIGSLVLLLAIGIIVFAGISISVRAPDMFTKLLAAGFTSFIAFQSIVNMAGVVRMIPMTGITLPFVSHGGWSLITSFAMLGILLAFSQRNSAASPTPQPVNMFVPVR